MPPPEFAQSERHEWRGKDRGRQGARRGEGGRGGRRGEGYVWVDKRKEEKGRENKRKEEKRKEKNNK